MARSTSRPGALRAAVLLASALTAGAGDLQAVGDHSPRQTRRARALGILADPQHALNLHTTAATQVISLYMYTNAFTYGKFGYASAIGVTLFALNMILTVLVFRLTRRERVVY